MCKYKRPALNLPGSAAGAQQVSNAICMNLYTNMNCNLKEGNRVTKESTFVLRLLVMIERSNLNNRSALKVCHAF